MTLGTKKPSQLTGRMAVFPSTAIKPTPGFVFSVPDGWVVDEAAGALTVVHPPHAEGDVWVNVMVSTDRVPRTLDFQDAARVTFARIKRATPDAEVKLEKMARFGSLIAYVRGVEMTSPRSGRRLAQVQAIFFGPAEGTGKTVDMFQVVGTCPAESAERYGPPFMEIIGSFRFV